MAAKLAVAIEDATDEEKTAITDARTAAAEALTAAESALSALPTTGDNAALVTLLDDAKTAASDFKTAAAPYLKARLECLPADIVAFMERIRIEQKIAQGYDAKTTEEKAAIDTVIDGAIAAFTTMIHVMR